MMVCVDIIFFLRNYIPGAKLHCGASGLSTIPHDRGQTGSVEWNFDYRHH
jgi:hypothetical protein